MDVFEIDMEDFFLPCQKDNKSEVFLADYILSKFETQQTEQLSWLDLLEIGKIQKIRWEYFFLLIEWEMKREDEFVRRYGYGWKKSEEPEPNYIEEHEPSYYGYTDKDGKFVDRFEIARRKRKAKQRVFDRITWGIFFFGSFLTIWFIFVWKLTFLEHIIYLTSLSINIYIVMLINYFKLKDLPRPFLPIIRTL